jgi:hypothetical protein
MRPELGHRVVKLVGAGLSQSLASIGRPEVLIRLCCVDPAATLFALFSDQLDQVECLQGCSHEWGALDQWAVTKMARVSRYVNHEPLCPMVDGPVIELVRTHPLSRGEVYCRVGPPLARTLAGWAPSLRPALGNSARELGPCWSVVEARVRRVVATRLLLAREVSDD